MKLFASLTSPYARKVRIALLEKRIDCQLEVINPWDDSVALKGINPLGKVPTLLLDDGTVLYDSRVIVEYLDALSPVSKLLPGDTRGLMQVKRWQALADGILDAGTAVFHERKRPTTEQSDSAARRQYGKIEAGLEALSLELADRPWCYGNGMTLADISVGACLGWLSLRLPELEWRTRYPNLELLFDKLETRQSFIDTVPPVV